MAKVSNPVTTLQKFFGTSTGHLVLSAVVTLVGAAVSAIVKDPHFATVVLQGGSLVSLVKYVVDLVRPGIPNL